MTGGKIIGCIKVGVFYLVLLFFGVAVYLAAGFAEHKKNAPDDVTIEWTSLSNWGAYLSNINYVNLGLAATVLFGLIGIVSAFQTAKRLNEIKHENKRLSESIDNMEDATRRVLTGFHEIFARAIWLLDKSTNKETYYVNFVFAFGAPHVANEEIVADFCKESSADELKKIIYKHGNKGGPGCYYSQAVAAFQALLKNVADDRSGKFKALVLDDQSVKDEFLHKLTSRDGYGFDVEQAWKEELVFRSQLISSAGTYTGDDFIPYIQSSLPMQFLITKIKSEEKRGKWGCLVFLIGTSDVAGVVPRGYYTELDHLTDLHIDYVTEIMKPLNKVDVDDWNKELQAKVSFLEKTTDNNRLLINELIAAMNGKAGIEWDKLKILFDQLNVLADSNQNIIDNNIKDLKEMDVDRWFDMIKEVVAARCPVK